MAKQLEHEVAHYYDLYPTKEDLMGVTSDHSTLAHYLMDVLTFFLGEDVCAVYENLNFYQTDDYNEEPLAPDIAVIKGVPFRRTRSWQVGQSGPPPHVVFEIASKETWKKDIKEKPGKYAQMGVQEYFAYDPNEPPLRKRFASRLRGWRFDPFTRQMRELTRLPDGRLWSVYLQSFLVPAGSLLHLTDQDGIRRLTQAEAEAQARQAEAQARQAEARRAELAEKRAEIEAKRAEAEKKRAEAEKKRAEEEALRAEAEKRQAEAERKRADVLAEKLRSLGVDPDQL